MSERSLRLMASAGVLRRESLLDNRDHRLAYERVTLAAPDPEGMLVFWEGQLTALFSFVAEGGDDLYGWHLELGFRDCLAPPAGRRFPTLQSALNWVITCCDGPDQRSTA